MTANADLLRLRRLWPILLPLHGRERRSASGHRQSLGVRRSSALKMGAGFAAAQVLCRRNRDLLPASDQNFFPLRFHRD